MMSESIIVIPCYNEAARLDAAAFSSFAARHPHVRFLFVDDGSTDGTGALLEQLHRSQPDRLLVHTLPRNGGKGEAVRQGLLRGLLQDGALRPDYIGFWDADLATPLDDIRLFAKLLDERPGIQMVFGSRVNLLGRCVRRRLPRHYVGRVFATGAAAVLGVGIYDTQCGAKLFRATDHFFALLEQPFISRWIFDVEIIAREIQARRGTSMPPVGDIIYEHPLEVWRDVAGSKLKLKDFFTVGMDLMRIRQRYMRRRRSAGVGRTGADR